MRRLTLIERFWSYVRPEPGDKCWMWVGYISRPGGYGLLGAMRGGRYGLARAHRLSWEIHYGPIPGGLCVLHKCDVRNCVNPSHLFLGTHGDNARDRMRKGRGGSLKIAGENHYLAKLTAKDVLDIRARCAAGEAQCSLAAEYGVNASNVGHIVSGKSWKHLSLAAGGPSGYRERDGVVKQ